MPPITPPAASNRSPAGGRPVSEADIASLVRMPHLATCSDYRFKRKMTDRDFSIGALSKRTGVNVETIRYYEKVGLLSPPPRTSGGHRLYATGELRRLRFIRRARELGFSLDEVRALLTLAQSSQTPCAQVKEIASAHLADVQSKIADLVRLESTLAETVSKCVDDRSPECPVLDALWSERDDGPTHH